MTDRLTALECRIVTLVHQLGTLTTRVDDLAAEVRTLRQEREAEQRESRALAVRVEVLVCEVRHLRKAHDVDQRERVEAEKAARAAAAIAERDRVVIACARAFDVTEREIRSHSRLKTVSLARQVAMFFMSRGMHLSSMEIGRELGFDHTTVLYAIGNVKRLVSEGGFVRERVEAITMVLAEREAA